MTKQEEIKLILYAIKIGQMTEDLAMMKLDKLGLVIKVGADIDIEMTDGTKLPMFAQYESLI